LRLFEISYEEEQEMRWMWQWVFAGLAVICLALPGAATVLHVPLEYPTIQAGIDAAAEGDTVLVGDGTYTGPGNRDLDFGGVNMVLMSEHGPEVTIIDCEGNSLDPHRGFYFHSGEDSSAVLTGFTILSGSVVAAPPNVFGGGIHCDGSSPSISGNIITNNEAVCGGGIYCSSSSATITANTITENTAEAGGGVFAEGMSPTIVGNTIAGNVGSGICLELSGSRIEGNTIVGNSGTDGGGICCASQSYPDIEGNLIAENSAVSSGGGVYCGLGSSAEIVGCTFTGNTASTGGGVSVGWAEALIRNSILWGDSAATGRELYVGAGGSIIYPFIWVRYSAAQGGSSAVYVGPFGEFCWGEGNIDSDPLFVSGPRGDYYLSQVAAGQPAQSPCVDGGDPSTPVPEGTTRTDEVPDSLTADMGYHYSVGSVGIGEQDPAESPGVSQYLAQNYPNPFSSTTTVRYSLAAPSAVVLAIYDIRGALVRRLVSNRSGAGPHQVVWDGRDDRGRQVGSGIYFSHLSVGGQTETRRMVLLR
jgi:parallel beta-helix repeat protein